MTKDVKTYGKAFKQAGTTFMDTIKERQQNDVDGSPNLFVNNLLNPEYVLDPNTDDDDEFIKFIESYNKEDKLKAWGPFFDGKFDETQAYKAMQFKMYWLFIEINKDEMTKILDFHLSESNSERNNEHDELLKGDKLCVYANVYKTRKSPVRWVAEVDLMFDNKKIYVGSIGADNQQRFWEKLDLFMNQNLRLNDDFISSYNESN